jgi:MSHA biogenesis protein MshO
MFRKFKAVTLIELLVAIILLSVITLGLAGINIFSRFHVISSERRAKLQNEASFVLEHMTKEINRAIGNTAIAGENPVLISGDPAVSVYVDSDASGGPGDGVRDTVNDHWIAYRFTGSTAPQFQVLYYPSYVNPTDPNESIAKRILSPPNITLTDNYLSVQLTACWDPAVAESVDNPCVDMSTRIKMPSVSTN